MQMNPCRTCPFKANCDLRDRKRAAVKGLGLTSIKFRCERLRKAFVPGMKVLARLDYVATGLRVSCESQEYETVSRVVEAYVMKFTFGKVRIFVPYDETAIPENDDLPRWWLQKMKDGEPGDCIHVLRVQPDRLTATGPFVRSCRHCGLPEGFDKPKEWSCKMYTEDHGRGYLEDVEMDCEYVGFQDGQ
jgi:hypothetical protein